MNGEAKNMNESWWGESPAPDGERGPALLPCFLACHPLELTGGGGQLKECQCLASRVIDLE